MSRCNSDRVPIIVIDFLSFCNSISRKNFNDIICGGRHRMVLERWTKILVALKKIGCKLICFSDLYIPEDKINKKLNNQDVGYVASKKLYDVLENGQFDLQTISNGIPRRPLKSIIHGMAVIASNKCDEFHRSTKHEADFEIARYAKQHDVLAVLSSDSDFLIFSGSWQLWSANDIRFTKRNRLVTIEYNRKTIAEILLLSAYQLPLFATLMGNDITRMKGVSGKFDHFFKTLDPTNDRIRNIAAYIRDINCKMYNSTRISNEGLRQIIAPILDDEEAYNKWEKLIQKSIDSYDTDRQVDSETSEPIEERLLGTGVYRSYMLCKNPIHEQHMPFYDLRGGKPQTNLPNLLTDWIKRKRGIVTNRIDHRSSTFTLLIKKDFNEAAKAYTEIPIYPDCESHNI